MTTTTTNLADIPRGTLVLVTVADDIPADCPPGQERGATAEERTYFATRSRDMGAGWLCLVVPDSDPRHRGMWRLDYDGYGLPPAEEGTQHYGWNVRAEYVTPYDVREGVLTLVRVLDTYPAGQRWPGAPRDFGGDAGVFYAVPSDFSSDHVTLVCAADDPRRGSMWRMGDGSAARWGPGGRASRTLRVYGLVGDHFGWNVPREHVEPAEAPTEAPTAPDADALARAREEGRQEGRREAEAEVERWKERATEIAHRYAEENSLCGEFDRAMEEIGLPSRSYSYTAEVTLTVTYDGERGDDVYAALHRHFLHSCDTDEITVDDVSVSVIGRE